MTRLYCSEECFKLVLIITTNPHTLLYFIYLVQTPILFATLPYSLKPRYDYCPLKSLYQRKVQATSRLILQCDNWNHYKLQKFFFLRNVGSHSPLSYIHPSQCIIPIIVYPFQNLHNFISITQHDVHMINLLGTTFWVFKYDIQIRIPKKHQPWIKL